MPSGSGRVTPSRLPFAVNVDRQVSSISNMEIPSGFRRIFVLQEVIYETRLVTFSSIPNPSLITDTQDNITIS